MKLLIVLGSINPNEDANSNIVSLLCKEFIDAGHEVDVLGMAFKKCKKKEVIDGVTYNRIILCDDDILNHQTEEFSLIDNKREKMQFLFLHPHWVIDRLWKHLRARFIDYKEYLYKKHICALTQSKKYDRIIVVTAPFYITRAVLKMKISAPLIWYQLDPNQSNITSIYKNKEKALKEEIEWYKQIEYAVIPKLVYEENLNNPLQVFKNKMIPANFPNVRQISIVPVEDDISFDKNYINLVFAGTFYPDIRNPEMMFNIISQLKDKRIKFHIVGGGCEDIIKKWISKCDHIIWHGYKSVEIATNAIKNADILVNLENTASNMLPSKINDYISTGHPIINFHPFEKSACSEYMIQYPACYDCYLNPDQHVDISKLEDFCIGYSGKTFDFDEIRMFFLESTPEHIAKLLLEGKNV